VFGNYIMTVQNHGILITSGNENHVHGNTIRDYGTAADQQNGVFVTTADSTEANGNIIEGNHIFDANATGNSAHVRIAEASGSAVGNIVRNNTFDRSATVTVQDSGYGTIRYGNINDDYPDLVRLLDHFLGDVIADQWGTAVGSDPQCVSADVIAGQIGGWARLSTGNDAAASMAVNGTQLHSGLNWEASQGALIIEVRLKISNIADVCVFFGFTDQIASLEMPIESAASANTITTNATNAVGFMFDTSMTDDNWWAVGVAADADATAQDSGTAPAAGTFQRLKIVISPSGSARFYINGSQVGSEMTGAITAATNITPVVAAFSRAAAQKNIDLDYIEIQGTPV
jgi:hypothetical protein